MTKEVIKENEETKNELVVTNNNLIGSDLSVFSADVKRVSSLDLSNEDDQIDLLNALQNCDHKLNDMVNQVIEVNGAYIEERPTEFVDEETGEVSTRSKYVTMLFGTNGETYVAGAYGVYNSIAQIAAIKGLPSKDNVMKLKVIKVPAKTAGHQLLKLILTK